MESAHTVVFKATNSTLCFITINPPGLIITHRSSQKTKFMREMYKNSTDALGLFIVSAVKHSITGDANRKQGNMEWKGQSDQTLT